MSQAETLHALDDQQYGLRKGRSAEDTALLKHDTYDLMCITHSDGATFDNDAKACYYRIIPNLMSLCGQQLGLPGHIAQAHATLLLNARYHVKTTLGVTDTLYSNSPEQPLYGPGQGSCAGPSIWAIISSLLLSIMSKKHSGISFCHPQQTATVCASWTALSMTLPTGSTTSSHH
jgi:hypothetical protein